MVGNGRHPETLGSTHFSNKASFNAGGQLCPPPPHHRLRRVRCHSDFPFPHINTLKLGSGQLKALPTPSCTLPHHFGQLGALVTSENGLQSGRSGFFVCLPGSKMASRSLAGPLPSHQRHRSGQWRLRVHVSGLERSSLASVQVSSEPWQQLDPSAKAVADPFQGDISSARVYFLCLYLSQGTEEEIKLNSLGTGLANVVFPSSPGQGGLR